MDKIKKAKLIQKLSQMKNQLSILLICLALTSCGSIRGAQVSQMDSSEIKAVSNKDLCHTTSMGTVVEEEIERRNLKSCSDGWPECADYGYIPMTQGFSQCLQNEAALEQQRRMVSAAIMAQGFQNAGNAFTNTPQQNQQVMQPMPYQPTYVTTNCNRSGNGFNCVSQ